MKFELLTSEWDFYFFRFGGQQIWVYWIIKKNGADYIEFPLRNAKIQKTEIGSLILTPDKNYNVFYYQINSGYRGNAKIDRVEGGEIVIQWSEFYSPLGGLGENCKVLINSQKDAIKVHSIRSGREIEKEEEKVEVEIEL